LKKPANAAGSSETAYGWVVVLFSFAVIAFCGSGYYITIVSLKTISLEFGWPRAYASLGYSVLFLGMGVGGIFMGWWSDRVGIAIPVAFGIIMSAIGSMLAGTSQGIFMFLMAHGVFFGLLGNSAFFVPLLTNITHWFDIRRGLAVGIVATGQSLAGTLWIPLFTYVTERIGWRASFLYYAVFLVCLLPFTLALRRKPPAKHSDQPSANGLVGSAGNFPVPTTVLVALLSAAIVCCCVSMAMPIVHLVSHVTDLGYSRVRGAEIIAIALSCSIFSRITWGWVSDQIGGLLTLLIASGLQAIMVFCFSLTDNISAMYVIGAFFGVAYGGIVPAYTIIMRHMLPLKGITLRVGIVLFFGTIGMALGGWLGGRIFDVAGHYSLAFLTGAAFNLCNLVIVGFLTLRYWQMKRNPGLVR